MWSGLCNILALMGAGGEVSDGASAAEVLSGMTVESLISDLALILVLGALSTLIFKKLKQPVVLGYIVFLKLHRKLLLIFLLLV